MNFTHQSSTLFKCASICQLVYWVLVAAWNIGGLVLISKGEMPLGPTASALPIFVLGLITAAMIYAGIKHSKVYPYLASLILLLSLFVVAQAFIKSPDLWPSDAWRYAGIAVNAFGGLAALMGLLWFFRSR